MEPKGSLLWFFSFSLCKEECFVVKSQECDGHTQCQILYGIY